MERFLKILLIISVLLSCAWTNIVKGGKSVDIDISNYMFVQIIGVDKDTEGGGYLLTVGGKKLGSSSEPGEKVEGSFFSAKGTTLAEAFGSLQTFSGWEVFLSYNEYIVVGEELARENIADCLDMFSRHINTTLGVKVFVSGGMTARQFIEETNSGTSLCFEKLRRLDAGTGIMSYVHSVPIYKLLGVFDDRSASGLLPVIRPLPPEMGTAPAEGMSFVLDSAAVFSNLQLDHYLSPYQSRGVNWLTQNIETTTLTVHDESGNPVALTVNYSARSITPVLESDSLKFKVLVSVSSNLTEELGRADIVTRDKLEHLRLAQQRVVEQEIAETIINAQSKGLDYIRFGEAAAHRYPHFWEHVRDIWPDIFSSAEVEIEVRSSITLPYSFKNSIRGRKSGE